MDTQTATAIASISVAIAVALITRRQWITNRGILKHQLFDRRYQIYERIAGFLADVIQAGSVAPGRDQEFMRETKQAYFVFACDAEVKALISDIYKHAVHLHALEAERPSTEGAPLKSNLASQREIKDWFSSTLASMETRFEKYLRLEH
jgi:hypothetical protein